MLGVRFLFCKLAFVLITLSTWAQSADTWESQAQTLAGELRRYVPVYYPITAAVQVLQMDEPAHTAYKDDGNVIRLDIDLLPALKTRFGDKATTALAYIIAHELIHFYYHKKDEPYRTRHDLEWDADAQGHWLAHLAGYYFEEGLARDLLTFLYEAYPTLNRSAYPEADTRIAQVKKTVQVIQEYKLPEVYRAATFLYGLGRFELAAACMEYIAHKNYRNEWVYNNLGVAILRQLLEHPDCGGQVFQYPIIFESHISLRDIALTPDAAEIRAASEQALQQAIAVNPHYENPYTNLAALYLIQNPHKPALALEMIEKYTRYSPNLSPEGLLLKALIYTYLDRNNEAEQYFKQAIQAGSLTAKYNYKLWKALSKPHEPFAQTIRNTDALQLRQLKAKIRKEVYPPQMTKNINGDAELVYYRQKLGNLTDKNFRLQVISTITLPNGKANPNLQIGWLDNAAIQTDMTGWHIRFYAEKRNRFYYLYSVKDNFRGTTHAGIRIGDAVDTVVEKYGMPDRIADDFYWYKEGNIIFEIKGGLVKCWTVFEEAPL
jgi:tetratricopeptide (TPR) repeat protein